MRTCASWPSAALFRARPSAAHGEACSRGTPHAPTQPLADDQWWPATGRHASGWPVRRGNCARSCLIAACRVGNDAGGQLAARSPEMVPSDLPAAIGLSGGERGGRWRHSCLKWRSERAPERSTHVRPKAAHPDHACLPTQARTWRQERPRAPYTAAGRLTSSLPTVS